MSNSRTEGGANAIRGYLYQFDKTILQVLEANDVAVKFEQEEDIIVDEKFYIQVKLRRTINFSHSRIRKATIQLMKLFLLDKNKSFRLYCYFTDKQPEIWRPSLENLRSIFSSYEEQFQEDDLRNFCSHFIIIFSVNYEEQFEAVLAKLKESFNINRNDVAILYHAILRSYLLDLSVKAKEERVTSYDDFKRLIDDKSEPLVFHGYERIMEADEYIRFVNKQYFKEKRPNLNNFERLLIFEYDDSINLTDLLDVTNFLGNKYFIKNKSPAPFIVIRGIPKPLLVDLKRQMVDKGIHFNDGTNFDGDRFRLEKILTKSKDIRDGRVKLVSDEVLPTLPVVDHFDTIYQLYHTTPIEITNFNKRHYQISVNNAKQSMKIILR